MINDRLSWCFFFDYLSFSKTLWGIIILFMLLFWGKKSSLSKTRNQQDIVEKSLNLFDKLWLPNINAKDVKWISSDSVIVAFPWIMMDGGLSSSWVHWCDTKVHQRLIFLTRNKKILPLIYWFILWQIHPIAINPFFSHNFPSFVKRKKEKITCHYYCCYFFYGIERRKFH